MLITSRSTQSVFLIFSAWVLLVALCAVGQDGSAGKSNSPGVADSQLPYNQQPINYASAKPNDPISEFQQRLVDGKVTLEQRGESGVLADVLRELKVPVSSQLLVFSRSSANARLIQPKTPRAIYFNDDVYVGWVPGSKAVELSAADPDLGGTFYSLAQSEQDNHRIRREESCLLCHLSSNTLRVPGHTVRSFTTDALGEMRTGWSRITHESAYTQRWAGWYVTGPCDSLKHMGNVFGGQTKGPPADFDLTKVCDLSRYLWNHSDVLPHLVLDHQAHGHNLITRLNYEARLEKPITALEPLVRYLLFLDEPLLPGPVIGETTYRTWFEQQGPRDSARRSLRQFDLQTRLFKHRLSYLIYSTGFEALPEATRSSVYRRIKEVLTTSKGLVPAIPATEAEAILQIVRETKTNLPENW